MHTYHQTIKDGRLWCSSLESSPPPSQDVTNIQNLVRASRALKQPWSSQDEGLSFLRLFRADLALQQLYW